ncbi:dehydrogenase/reductase SDR family member 11-like [Haliotis rufescens]|uniref:dehydrogenase/reductase SDR family member 11-like n=1 Tax=Haliotis rufescens TaxID=6454 RepID=UPI00201ED6D5|nr:dehydrogenase/reductase SDR family member 11-like [Haliotis rufescens]
MQRWSGRVALVTGASAGIGAGLVKALVKHGMKVVGCARNYIIPPPQTLADELKDEPGTVKAVRCDVSKEEDVLAMFKMIRADPDLGGVDVCINNAGLTHNEPLLRGSTCGWKDMLEVGVLGKRVGPRKCSHFYGATKFAVSAIQEGLMKELKEINSGIRVTSVSPGVVRTEILYRLNADGLIPEELEVEDITAIVIFALGSPHHVQVGCNFVI